MRSAIFCLVMTAALLAAPAAAVKMERIANELEAAERSGKKVRFQLTEGEMNEYVAHRLRTERHPGVHRIQMTFLPNNRLSADAVIDYDAVQQWRPGTIPLLLRPLLRGQRNLHVDCAFQVQRGLLTFDVEGAEYEGVTVPGGVVEKVIEVVARRQPEPIDTTRPIQLPSGVQTLGTRQGVMYGSN